MKKLLCIFVVLTIVSSFGAHCFAKTATGTHDKKTVTCTIYTHQGYAVGSFKSDAKTAWNYSSNTHMLGTRLFWKSSNWGSFQLIDSAYARKSAYCSTNGYKYGVHALSTHYVYHTKTNGTATKTYKIAEQGIYPNYRW